MKKYNAENVGGNEQQSTKTTSTSSYNTKELKESQKKNEQIKNELERLKKKYKTT